MGKDAGENIRKKGRRLSGPGRFRDPAEAACDGRFLERLYIQKNQGAALRVDDMARVGAPNWVLAFTQETYLAAGKV